MTEELTAKELVDIIQPNHHRTSCSDKKIYNGFYSSTTHTRCGRCTLLQILKEGRLPESHVIPYIPCSIDEKKVREEKND